MAVMIIMVMVMVMEIMVTLKLVTPRAAGLKKGNHDDHHSDKEYIEIKITSRQVTLGSAGPVSNRVVSADKLPQSSPG